MRYNLIVILFFAAGLAACGDTSNDEADGSGLFGDTETPGGAETTVGNDASDTSGGATTGATGGGDTTSMGDITNAEDEASDRPELSMGPNDALAQMACALLDGEQQRRIAVDAASDAGQVLVIPSKSSAYLVTLPESGTGYITLEVPDWSIVIGASADYTQTISILDPGFVTEETLPLSWNGTCPENGLTDQRTKFHSWGSFTVEIVGEPGDEVPLSFIKQED